MKHILLICTIVLSAMFQSSRLVAQSQQDKATARVNDLRLASYVTSRQVEQLATDSVVRNKAMQTIRRMGFTKLYLEVYRSGHVVSSEHLIFVRDWLKSTNIEVVGGIATVPGGNFGIRQKGPLGWFNWQNEKTQRDLEKVIRMAAGIFDSPVPPGVADRTGTIRFHRARETGQSRYHHDCQVSPVVRPFSSVRLRYANAAGAVRYGLGRHGDPRPEYSAVRIRAALRGIRKLPLARGHRRGENRRSLTRDS